jgi:hypothetical protein
MILVGVGQLVVFPPDPPSHAILLLLLEKDDPSRSRSFGGG